MPRIPPEVMAAFEEFTRGPSSVRAAVSGIGAAVMSRPGREGWAIRDVLIHLADSELVRAVRLRRILVEDNPLIEAMDEGLWQRRLQYLWRSPEAALAVFELTRFTSAEILRETDAAGWSRTGMHAEDGMLTIADLVRRGAGHVAEHVEQIGRLRAG